MSEIGRGLSPYYHNQLIETSLRKLNHIPFPFVSSYFLTVTINIRYLSITETMRHAAKTYLSTLAMSQLDTILRHSVKYGEPKPPKKGVKNQATFKQMQEMRCNLDGVGLIKMMVGIKRTGEKILYCITATGE